ncbi:serine/threonine-protein kinase-like protein CCR4 [Impatiens glandulifera]|uniref:serine/threonine-protein kinase-like protein CCR4 n=1 Tax=Impatiens glandulifera TaxID=253017 RepID=UPI001FB06369|nr:serine/threonine-protein kinase-like protein CCR4 [Impatiens glandulifera]
MAILHSLLLSFLFIPIVSSLSTFAISETGNRTVICALISYPNQPAFLNCTGFPPINTQFTNRNVSFSALVAGQGFVCGLRSISTSSILGCWRFNFTTVSDYGTGSVIQINVDYKRVYNGSSSIRELRAGNTHVCGLFDGTNELECWQWHRFNSSVMWNLSSIAVGDDFVCGLTESGGNVKCSGRTSQVVGGEPVGNYSVIAAGNRHACAISSINGTVKCWGNLTAAIDDFGVVRSLALGDDRSCGLMKNGTVICWGGDGFKLPESLRSVYFLTIEAKRKVFCGVKMDDYSLYCWGNEEFDSLSNNRVPIMTNLLPGPCVADCPFMKPLPNYASHCTETLMICDPSSGDEFQSPPSSPGLQPPPPIAVPPPSSTKWNNKTVAFLVVGSTGSLCLLILSIFFVWKYCNIRGCRVHDSGRLEQQQGDQPTAAAAEAMSAAVNINQQQQPNEAKSGPVLVKKLSHLISMRNGDLEEFSLDDLLQATNNFSNEHKIGSGSFGSVYFADLQIQGETRRLAIKRAEASKSSSYNTGMKRQEDKDSAFLNELEFLSRLNHRNLLRLYGYCEDTQERILIYDYMNNGTLYHHLHKTNDSPLNTWPARIKAALDAARGIEYLHVYAVPPIIHRDIKSSNILLDDTWTAKLSDFGLSMLRPADVETPLATRAAGTFGYMDPEYYKLEQLTTKSDVYSFGVVMLEILSGKKAIHKNENGVPRNVVDYMFPYIEADDIHRVLDRKVPAPTPFEIEAVTYVSYLAADCVSPEGRDRPSMSEVVSGLERALGACGAKETFSRSTTESSTG